MRKKRNRVHLRKSEDRFACGGWRNRGTSSVYEAKDVTCPDCVTRINDEANLHALMNTTVAFFRRRKIPRDAMSTLILRVGFLWAEAVASGRC